MPMKNNDQTHRQSRNGDYAIAARGLTKIYDAGKGAGQKKALDNVEITIPHGSFYGLLGPNGAGKSTFINILAGLVLKTSGTIDINGISQDEQPRETRAQLGIVPQEVVLDPFFNITEMLEYYAGYFGVKKAERRTRQLLEDLHLSDKAGVNSRRLSGGMKRRVLIAKALVHNPPILILDEPTAGVDVELRTQLWEYVRELNEGGMTILLTTHYLEEAEELCDTISIINHGKVIANDSTHTLMQKLDQKKITLHFDQPFTAIPEALSPYQPQQLSEKSLILTYQRDKNSIGEILHFTNDAGLHIKDLSTEEPDLEDVFRHLVNG